MTGAEGSTLYVCEDSQMYVFHPKKARKMLTTAMKLEKISITPNSIFLVMITCNTLDMNGGLNMNYSMVLTSSWIWKFWREEVVFVYGRKSAYQAALTPKLVAAATVLRPHVVGKAWTLTVMLAMMMRWGSTMVVMEIIVRSLDVLWSQKLSQTSRYYNACDFLFRLTPLSEIEVAQLTDWD